jgi:nucleoside-diphosphate-sugar epimerase
MEIFVTGATGFVGRVLCERLLSDGHSVRAVRRRHSNVSSLHDEYSQIKWFEIDDLTQDVAWETVMNGCDCVIHLAARVHLMKDNASDPLSEFRAVNCMATLQLARAAAKVGVRRFLFLSSIKVNGESGIFSEKDTPAPEGGYAISKWEAEQGLGEIAAETGMDLVILRPPLVYGPGVGANFLRLMKGVDHHFPFPFGRVDNKRSFVYVENLVDAMVYCIFVNRLPLSTYLVSDGERLSTPELIQKLGMHLGCSPCLLPVPISLMNGIAACLGKKKEVGRLLGSLAVDDAAIREDLGWVAPFSIDEGLKKTIAWYRQKNKK